MRQFFLFFVISTFALYSTSVSGQGVQVKPGTNVIVGNGTTMYVDGGGSVVLQDDLTYSPSLLEKGTVTFNGGGDLKVQQYLERNMWHIISSPVSNENIGAYLDVYLYSYDEPTDAFTNLYQPLTVPLNVGEGYHVWSVSSSPDYVTLNGSSNRTDVNVTLSVTPSTNHSGWNLIGNPFPCALDWNGDADWNLNNVGATIYLFDAGAGNYKTWNYVTGTGTNGKTDGLIAATQGFWVRTSDTLASQPSYSLTLPASQRVASASTAFYKSSNTNSNMLRIKVSGERFSDECIIGFDENATDSFDNDYDGYKLFPELASPKLFTERNGVKMCVDIMNSIENHESVPVSFLAGKEGVFELQVDIPEGFYPETPVFLEDKKDGVMQDLRSEPQYGFTATPLDDPDRFVIHFSNTLGVDDPDINGLTNSIHIFGKKHTVVVNIPFDFKGEIFVFDVLGKQVAHTVAVKGMTNIPVQQGNEYYIVKVVGESLLKTGKVYIK